MPRIISIPNQCSTNVQKGFLSNSFFDIGDDKEAIIRFHPTFVHLYPYAISMLAAWADWCLKQGIKIRTENIEASGIAYLWRMGLLQYIQPDYETSRTEHEPAGRFIPITKIETSEDLHKFITDLVPLLHLETVDQANAVRYCLSEMTRNVLEHAGDAPAFVSAQFFKKAHRVSIGVADAGVGIFNTLKDRYSVTNDSAALIEAMKPGVSGTTANIYGSRDNAGAGLFFTKSIASFTKEYFLLISGKACYKLMRRLDSDEVPLNFDPTKDRHSLQTIAGWNGTAVAIDINIEEVGDFHHIVSLIREVFFGSKPRKPDVSKRVRFR